jgi:hypothetical protein
MWRRDVTRAADSFRVYRLWRVANVIRAVRFCFVCFNPPRGTPVALAAIYASRRRGLPHRRTIAGSPVRRPGPYRSATHEGVPMNAEATILVVEEVAVVREVLDV